MKPAAEPTPGEIVETTTRRRVVPATESQSNQTPELWEYLRTLAQRNDPNDWARHMTYVYRVEPTPSITLLKSANQFLTMPNGQQVSLADQEEIEFALNQNFGGGTFRIIVKKGPQWATQARFSLGGPVRTLTIPIDTGQPTAGGSSSMPLGTGDPTAAVAGRAFDALSSQERQSAEIGFAAMRTAADVMQRFAAPGATATPQDELMREVLAELRASRRSGMSLQEILAAAGSVVALFKELGILGGNANPMVGQVMEIAMKRLLEPPTSGNPVNTGAALVQMLPTIGNHFVEGLREFAKVRENEAKIIAMQRAGVPVATPGQNPQVLPPVPPNGGQPQPQPANGAPSVEFVDRKIIEFIKAPTLSAEQAADEAMSFLDSLDPHAVVQLASLGETGLLQLFSARPILQQATSNMPRLVEFIRAFLRMHAEDVASEQAQAATAPAKPPLPN